MTNEQIAFVSKFLDWPFLAFVLLLIAIFVLRKPLSNALSRGLITLTWGEKSFTISELPEQLNENFAPVTDDIEEIRSRLEKIEQALPALHENIIPGDDAAARERMLNALGDGQYRWRSIERLASIGGVEREKAGDILRSLDEVVFSTGKSGRTIARLSNR